MLLNSIRAAVAWTRQRYPQIFDYLRMLRITEAVSYVLQSYARTFHARNFNFQGRAYRYFYHTYNSTWVNERAVEVPIVMGFVEESAGKRILEIGNVLSHYSRIPHDVVDKYEVAPGVINEDIVDFKPSKGYDLIVSISTFEHVGWDEEPKEPKKIMRAIKRLPVLLRPGGKAVVTLPLGYNTEFDRLLDSGELLFQKRYYLKKISRNNVWIEVPYNDVRNARFDYPRVAANAVFVGVLEKKPGGAHQSKFTKALL